MQNNKFSLQTIKDFACVHRGMGENLVKLNEKSPALCTMFSAGFFVFEADEDKATIRWGTAVMKLSFRADDKRITRANGKLINSSSRFMLFSSPQSAESESRSCMHVVPADVGEDELPRNQKCSHDSP
jgi:hypothetical protein